MWEPDAIDQELLRSAAAKRKDGKQLNRQEAAVVRKAAASREEQQRWRHYHTIPQKHWVRMSGRQWKILRQQSELYGIAFAEPVIDLEKVVRQIHDFFAKHFRKFATPSDPEGEMLVGCSQAIKDEFVRQQTRKAKLQADEMEGKLVNISELFPLVQQAFGSVRKTGEALQRRFGPEALSMLEDGMSEFERVIDQMERMQSASREGGDKGTDG